MRTTVDLPGALHAQIKRYAEARRESLSSVLVGLIGRGAESVADLALGHSVSPVTGLLVFDGPAVTAADVARLIDEGP